MPTHRPLIVRSLPAHRPLTAHPSSAHCPPIVRSLPTPRPLIAHSSSAHRPLSPPTHRLPTRPSPLPITMSTTNTTLLPKRVPRRLGALTSLVCSSVSTTLRPASPIRRPQAQARRSRSRSRWDPVRRSLLSIVVGGSSRSWFRPGRMCRRGGIAFREYSCIRAWVTLGLS